MKPEEIPPPVELPEPRPTLTEMRQLRQRLKAAFISKPEEALQLAEAVGDMEQTERLLREQLQKNPGSTELQLRLAEVLSRRLQFAKARQIYQKLQKEDPRQAVPYLALADIERLEGKPDASWKQLEKGVAANRDSREGIVTLVALAQRYDRLRDKKTAESVLQTALKLQPDSHPVLMALARIYQETGRIQKGRNALTRILESDPKNIPAKKQLAALIAAQPQQKEDVPFAGRLIGEVFQAGQGGPDDYMTVAALMEHDSDWGQAAYAYTTLLKQAPEMLEARYRLIRVYQRLKRADYVREEQARYTKLRAEQEKRSNLAVARVSSPLSATAHFAEAQFAEKTKDYRVAAIAYDLAAQLAPNDPKIRTARTRFFALLDGDSVIRVGKTNE